MNPSDYPMLDEAYLSLIKDTRVYDLTLAESASIIAQRCADALSVSRASIWVSNADQSALNCLSLYQSGSGTYESGAILEEKTFPAYFHALYHQRVVDAHNAFEDPRTSELKEPYLKPLDVQSLLDATVRHQGTVRGVVCLEMQGQQRDWTNEEQMFVASVADLVSQRLIVEDLVNSETKYRGLFESTTDGISIFGGNTFIDVNPAMCRIFGGTREQIIGLSPIDLSPEYQPDGRLSEEGAAELITACLAGKQQKVEWVHRRLDGSSFPAEITLNRVRYSGKETLFAILRDITDQKAAEMTAKSARSELEHRAIHDSLTGLLNREKLHEHVSNFIEGVSNDTNPAINEQPNLALLLLDLNRFKEINDTLGHETGDKVLVKIAAILNQSVKRTGGCLFRLGGDEFVAVFDAKTCTEPFDNLAQTIHHSLKTSICIDDITMEMSASIGIALHPENGVTSHELLRCADVAMYQAKNTDGLSSKYDAQKDLNNTRRLAMMVELGSAIRNDELTLHFQPRIEISTNELTGCEALVRWEHTSLGLVPPGEFLPLAEMGELIHPLTDWVLVNVIKQIQHYQQRGQQIPIAMNISARNLTDIHLVDRIESLLTLHNIPAYLLEIEITESALINHPKRALTNLHRLNKLGVPIAIDDFGTGYSSLSYLKKLPVSTLKIDKSFVIDMLNDESDSVIVESTINLAHNFSLTVVAEGVEDQETLDALGLQHCEQAQGFFIAKPMPSKKFDLWLDEHLSNLKNTSLAS